MNFQNVTRIMENSLTTMSVETFQQAGSALSEAKNLIRETLQSETASDTKNIIKKLSAGQPLSTAEMNLIRLWIVGDAESYIMMENNLQDWIDEFGRLKKTLADFTDKPSSAEDLFKLQGLLEDAVRISYDIGNFLEKKERVKKFESSISDGLDESEINLLIKVLTAKLQSSEY
jgi:hypothetical protein